MSDRERPVFTEGNGPLMARRTAVRPGLMAAPWSSPVLLDSCRPSGPRPLCQGSRSDRVRLGLDTADSAETIEQRGGRHHQPGGSGAVSSFVIDDLAGTGGLLMAQAEDPRSARRRPVIALMYGGYVARATPLDP